MGADECLQVSEKTEDQEPATTLQRPSKNSAHVWSKAWRECSKGWLQLRLEELSTASDRSVMKEHQRLTSVEFGARLPRIPLGSS